MQPKTQLQIRAVELSKTLADINEPQMAWANKNVLKHVGYRTTAKTNCLDCGHQWKTGNNKLLLTKLQDKVTCPHCGTTLEITDTKGRIYTQRLFYAVIQVVKEFQVVRLFELRSYHKVGQPVKPSFLEVASQWILPNGKYEVIARLRGGFGFYNDSFNGYLEIRGKQSFFEKYNILPDGIYPKMSVLPIYKLHGFKGKFHDLTPHNLFSKLGHSTQAETLLKAKQFGLLEACIASSRSSVVRRHWDSIKICIRNGYKVNDPSMWLDYIELLDYFKKDLRSPKYVCTATLKKDHDRLMRKKKVIDAKERLEREIRWAAEEAERRAQKKAKQIEQIANDEKEYQERVKAFIGLQFSSENLTFKVLETVAEFLQEGNKLDHCVFTNEYHKTAGSLILSARIDGEPVETIEVDLTQMKISQARGMHNHPTKYHDKVIKAVKKKLPAIGRIYAKLQKTA